MAPPPTALAIHDTRTGVVHLPERDPYAHRDATMRPIENLDEFVAWLNAKAKTERFAVITVTQISRTARGGLGRQFTEYLKGHPDVRVRAAVNHLVTDYSNQPGASNSLRLARSRDGSWTVPHAVELIRAIAKDANVPFNDARIALLNHLRAELGDVIDRVVFPPEDAVRPADDTTDEHGEDAYPVDI
jgi:hypothetical protein